MRRALLYVLAALFLVAIVSVAWLTRERVAGGTYETRSGDTGARVAAELGVSIAELARANPELPVGGTLEPGTIVVVPEKSPTMSEVWTAHGIGLVAELAGVLMSFWLAIVAGILPRRLRGQVFGISVVLAVASYAGTWAVASDVPRFTPQFVFSAVKDGFAWSAAFPLFARMLGLRDLPAAPDAAPPRSPAPPADDRPEATPAG